MDASLGVCIVLQVLGREVSQCALQVVERLSLEKFLRQIGGCYRERSKPVISAVCMCAQLFEREKSAGWEIHTRVCVITRTITPPPLGEPEFSPEQEGGAHTQRK